MHNIDAYFAMFTILFEKKVPVCMRVRRRKKIPLNMLLIPTREEYMMFLCKVLRTTIPMV